MLCRQLSYEWSSNEQYSYGWFVPFFAAFLFWLRWESWPKASGSRLLVNGYSVTSEATSRTTNTRKLITIGAVIALAVLAPIRLFEVANPDWRPLSWIHALVVVSLTLLAIWYWGGSRAVRHFAFPVCFILVAVPWISPIEGPIVQGLMQLVAAVATETLTLFGIPAQLEGSLIRVSTGLVGVNEACSGVRSLQTSLMIGLLFGELKRLSVKRRAALVAVALTIAFLANCGRAFFLVWIGATQNLAAVERWHDLAGYAVVGAVFVGTIAIASALAKGNIRNKESGDNIDDGTTAPNPQSALQPAQGLEPVETAIRNPQFSLPPLSFLIATFLYILLVEGAIEGWYRWHERNFVPTTAWTVRWPENAPGFREVPIAEGIRSTLRYDHGREAIWRVNLSPNEQNSPPASCTMFFFRWQAGSASPVRARAHRPDICLPAGGWLLESDEGTRDYEFSERIALPFRHFRFAKQHSGEPTIFADAFFCQREEKVPANQGDRFDATRHNIGDWSAGDRVRVVRQGLRNQGQQVLELVFLAPRDVGKAEVETRFQELVKELVESKK